MSKLFNKTTQKVRQKAEQALDQPRTSSRENRAYSPVSSQHIESSTDYTPRVSAQSLATIAVATVAQPSTTKMSVLPPSQRPGPATAHVSLLPAAASHVMTPPFATPPSPPTILATTGSAIKGLLAAARDGSDLFLPLKAALVGIVALWDVFDRTAEARTEFRKLESRLAAFVAIANAHQDMPREVDESLQRRLGSLSKAVQALWETVEQRQARGGIARMAQSSIDLDDIKTLIDSISALLEVFQFESSIAVEKRLGLIVERLDADISDRVIRDRQQKQEEVMKTIKSGDNFVSEAADYEQPSYAGCMVGTRVGVLSKCIAWIKDDPMAIFWLSGMAGTGKTSIAVSLCRILRQNPDILFGGGYFCSRSAGSIARKDVRNILPTLAANFASRSLEFAASLVAELEQDRNVGHKPVMDQIGSLLRKPLATFASSSPIIVFVIDALDECGNEREMAELLTQLVDLECTAKIKFILTSRPEMHIRGTPISSPAHSTILQLHTIRSEEVMSDIQLYIEGTLRAATPKATWYTDHDTKLLVNLSGGLFIFASTVLKYVLDREEDEDRHDRLRKVTSAVIARTTATSAMDELYRLVLTEASDSNKLDEEELDRMKHSLACILTTRVPLSVEALATLIGVTPGRLRGSLERLHSLVHLPSSDKQPGLKTLHASLGDYLFERGPQHGRISATLGHDILARGCLRRLAQEDLCFNVSRSRSSFEPNRSWTPDELSPSLTYACLHWAHHIDAALNRSACDTEVGRIFRSKFLFWLEVLSITGKIGLASGLLRIARSAIHDPVVSQFLRDAGEFVAASHVAISRSAPHIYISALPFAAKDSLVYRDFAKACTGTVLVETLGIPRHGGKLVATLVGHENQVNTIAYAPSGLLLVSGSDDGTVRIWDARTGEETTSPLQSNDGIVLSVAFSPDGQRVASGGEGQVVHVWGVATGQPALPPLRGHSSWIRSLVFSSDGKFIATGSDDKTIRLWNGHTGQRVLVMNGHTDCVSAVAFVPGGRLLASASRDQTVRLWSVLTGKPTGEPLANIKNTVRCLAVSSDGCYLAAGSSKPDRVRIWNLGAPESSSIAIQDKFGVGSLVFSPDGSRLVTAGRQSLRCWDPQTGREIPGSSLTGHSEWVYTAAFSPDGLFLASGSFDRTIRIWNAIGDLEGVVTPLPAHSSSVNSVAVSHDGTFIASGSYDCSVRVWNAATGKEILKLLPGLPSSIWAVAISSDDRLIAAASADHTVRLWEARTGAPVGEPLQEHEDEVRVVAFSSDIRWLASGSDDGSVRVWDVTTVRAAPFAPHRCNGMVLAVSFSPDGSLLAAADFGGNVHFWWSGTDQQARTPLRTNADAICCICFSPDGKRIVSGGINHVVQVWDVDDGCMVFTLEGHFDWVRSVAYSPDGLHIVSASHDKTLRIWNATTGAAVSTLFGHSDLVLSVTFASNGRTIVSAGVDSTIHMWDMEAALLLPSRVKRDPLARLGSTALEDGWLVGPSGELILWIPVDYRGHIQLSPCSMVIGSHRVVLAADQGLYLGDQWASCWRNGSH